MAVSPDTEETRTIKAGGNVPEYSVSELSMGLKKTIETAYDHVRVRGEIGRVSRPASGHVYLDLKDDKAVIAGVVWKGVANRLRVQPEQGLEVVATGRLTTFPGQSKYQIVIESVEPAGVGALMALLEERKKKLQAEGLFDDARKKPLPTLPALVGIVTSPTGAVIRDMLHGFDERFPTRVMVWPVRVQGETSAQEVAAAIAGFNRMEDTQRPDVLIVARGGGSLEDLWGFNEEIVARAVAASEIPVISAVGHETDWTLIDFVADARAPTPTKAAEWAVPRQSELLERLGELDHRLRLSLRRVLEESRSRLRAASRGLPRMQDLVALPRQRFDTAAARLGRALMMNTQAHANRFARVQGRLTPGLIRQRIAHARGRHGDLQARSQRAIFASLGARRQSLSSFGKLLQSLSHHGVLERGFALVRDGDGAAVRSAQGLEAGTPLQIEWADGRVDVSVAANGNHGKKGWPRRKKPVPGKTDQGSLF
ncbi:MAG: exodeoxyribonuclease VII large subunit [Hyphomicrobiaceae bacterium]